MNSQRHRTWLFSATALLACAFAACGSLDEGEIIIVPDASGDGGDDSVAGGGNAGKAGSNAVGGDGLGGDGSGPGGVGNVGAVGNQPGVAGASTGDGGEPPVVIGDDPPEVVSIMPADMSTDVDPLTTVVIEFTEDVDPTTFDGAVVVRDGKRVVPTKIQYAEASMQLTFDARLDLLAGYEVTLGTGLKDLNGTALASPFSSTFKVRDGKWGRRVRISNPSGTISTQPYPSPVWDAQGNGLVVWAQAGTTSALEIWGRFYNAGKGWANAVKISTATTGCSSPTVAMNAAGDAVVAWQQTEGMNARVFARRYTRGAWEAKPLRVEAIDMTDVRRVVAGISGTGEAHVVWRHWSTYQSIYASRSTGTGAWTAGNATYLTGSFEEGAGPSLSFAPDGSGFMVWATSTGTTNNVRVARYMVGTGWINLETIAGSGTVTVNEDAPPTIAADADGGAMAAWIRPADVATSRFTRAGGWTTVAPADAGAGTVAAWAPRLANDGNDFMVFWHQSVGSVRNAFANRYSGTTWAAQPALLSNGNTSVHEWSDTGFGLDRHGNGIAIWAQGDDVRSARFVASGKRWQPDSLVETLVTTTNPVIESLVGVSPNGMAAAMYAIGYPYHQTHNAIYGAIFE